MSKKSEANLSEYGEEEQSVEIDEKLVSMERQINELSKLFGEKLIDARSHGDESVECQWRALMDRILSEVEPGIWMRDASVQNLADGGETLEMKFHVIDGAWLTTTEYGPMVHHHYEVEFYDAGDRAGSMRGKVVVTFSLLFEVLDNDELDEHYSNLHSKLGRGNSDFDRSSLYRHSWPRLTKFVEGMVDEFFWDKLSLPDTLDTSSLPIASVYVGNTGGM